MSPVTVLKLAARGPSRSMEAWPMRIVASELVLAGSSEHTVQKTHEERLLAWVGERPKEAARGLGDAATISDGARARAALVQAAAPPRRSESSAQVASGAAAGASGAEGATSADGADAEDPRILIMRLLVQAMTGQRVKTGSIQIARASSGGGAEVARAAQRAPAAAAPAARPGWGLEIDVRDTTAETQAVSFEARGTVQTADGRTIDLAASMSLRDERVTVTSTSIRVGDAVVKDPLVLNFSGAPADLEGTVDFDLDADGAAERMAFVGSGSGVLALDANGAARPKDGAQLFGAKTGDGFAELAAYDDDHNGFIDEADAVYQRLGVWTRDASGAEGVRSLADAGVGAISVASAATRMDVRDAGGALEGRLQATGVYLAESGRVGVVQQLDLAVAELPTAPAAHVDVVG